MIEGVKVVPLEVRSDERGYLMEILRRDDPHFKAFGQVYLTAAYPGVVKAWHLHRRQTDYFTCVKGEMKLVLHDDREDSPTRGETMEFFIGERNPRLVIIPPGILHGFKTVGTETAMVINCPTEPYDRERPDEERIDPHNNDIPYSWERRDG